MYQQRHNRSSLCIEQIGDGEYRCRVTGVVLRTTTLPVICGLHEPHLIAQITEPECPYSQIIKRLTPDGLTRLDRCRAANCGMMHRVNGAITCVGMQGKKCGWQAKWIRCLNREEEFGCGGYNCPHWKSISDPQ